MGNPENQIPKSPATHLHIINLIVAMTAGIISIVGGIYTLKSNVFSGPSYGSLQGIVRDEKIAKPLVLTLVEVSGIDGAVVNVATTDGDGHYLVDPLKAGSYVVKFTAPRHIVQAKTIKIEKNLKSSINVDLVPEVIPEKTIMVEPVAPSQRIAYPPVTAPKTTAAAPDVAETNSNQTTGGTYPSQPYGQAPQGSGFHRRGPRSYYGSSAANPTGTSQSNNLTQTGVQLVEALINSKTDQKSSSGS